MTLGQVVIGLLLVCVCVRVANTQIICLLASRPLNSFSKNILFLKIFFFCIIPHVNAHLAYVILCMVCFIIYCLAQYLYFRKSIYIETFKDVTSTLISSEIDSLG